MNTLIYCAPSHYQLWFFMFMKEISLGNRGRGMLDSGWKCLTPLMSIYLNILAPAFMIQKFSTIYTVLSSHWWYGSYPSFILLRGTKSYGTQHPESVCILVRTDACTTTHTRSVFGRNLKKKMNWKFSFKTKAITCFLTWGLPWSNPTPFTIERGVHWDRTHTFSILIGAFLFLLPCQ